MGIGPTPLHPMVKKTDRRVRSGNDRFEPFTDLDTEGGMRTFAAFCAKACCANILLENSS